MLSLLRQIHGEQSAIEEQLQLPNKKLEFFQEFFKKYQYGVMKNYYEMDKCDLILASLAADDDSIPFEELEEIINSNRLFFEGMDMDMYQTFADTYINLVERNALNEAYFHLINGFVPSEEECEEDIDKKTISLLMQIAETYEIPYRDFAKILKVFEYELALNTNEDGFAHAELPLMHALSTMRLLDETKEKYLGFTDVLTDPIYKKHMTPSLKQKTKSTMQGVKSAVEEHMSRLKRYYELLASEDKSTRRRLVKDQSQYSKVEQDLYKMLKFPETLASEKDILKLPNASIRIAALKQVYAHNLAIYQQKESEYNQLAANDASNYRILLANYGLSPSNYEVGTIMNNPLVDVENMLEQLQKVDIKTPAILLSILQTSNLETVSNFVGLVQKGIITTSALVDNLSALDPTSKDYENMMRNLSLVQQQKLNPRYFSTNLESLLADHQLFKTNLETLGKYDLVSSLKTGIDSTFIGKENLQEAIDTLLELGYESNLEECLELLNHKDRFARLKLLKSLNMGVSTTEELLTVLTTEKFIVPDSMIEDYLYNAVPFYIPTPNGSTTKRNMYLSKLDEFQTSSRTYTIGGVIISKNKVSSNLATQRQFARPSDRLLHGILSGSYLSNQEVESVITTLSDKKIYVKK